MGWLVTQTGFNMIDEERYEKAAESIVILATAIGAVLIVLMLSGIAYADTPPVKGAVVQVPLRAMCVSGYSATVRPPVSYTNSLKAKLGKKQGVNPRDYELDHLVPISIGGDPRSPENLWMQPWPDARKKDVRESELHRLVCTGRISVSKAQAEMAGWK